MFKLGVILCLCVSCLGVGWVTFHTQPEDAQRFEELLHSSDPSQQRKQAGGLVTYCQQFREGVTKQMWVTKQTPLQCVIQSHSSELFLLQEHKQLGVIEELQGVRCVLQEELCYTSAGEPYQVVDVLQAASACYDYNTQTLVADDATIWKYHLPGHTFTEIESGTPLMQGVAQHAELVWHDETFDLKLNHFQATVTQ